MQVWVHARMTIYCLYTAFNAWMLFFQQVSDELTNVDKNELKSLIWLSLDITDRE